MDIIEQAIHNVKLQLGVLPISREIAEEILRSDSNSYQSQLLQHIATDSFGAAIPLNHSSLFTDAAKPHIKNTSSHGSTLEQGSDESAANMPKINSDNSTTSGSTSEIPKTNPDPPKKNVTQHSQVTHKAWDPATRNQVFIIRQIYTEYRETITSNLTKTWLSMRNSMLQHASLLPVPDETIIQFDENMKKFISRQILILQYESLRHIMRLVASPIPIGYDVSSESIKTNEEMNRLRVQAFMPPGSDLLLNYSQVVLLESSFAVSQTHSKLEKKRLAYLTGLRIGDVSRW
ncbi:hypothetical protein QVD99_000207 [Batrachochytrium dendrobatidis]|nr:hypothetical protein QVD99_000207 [Batrachochytrium dendrobatidis]